MPQPLAPADAPQARLPRYRFTDVVPQAQGLDVQALAAGWRFEPQRCGDTSGGAEAVNCGPGDLDLDPGAGGDQSTWHGVWLWEGDFCSAMAYGGRDWDARARRQLAAHESYRLAAEVWDGAVTNADTEHDTNRYLAAAGSDSDTLTNGATDIVNALGCLEHGLAETLAGEQGMIHMTPQVLLHAVAAQALVRDGSVWATPMGHVVVADAGYSGSGPGGSPATTSSQWLYGTAWVTHAMGPVELHPGSLEDARNLAAALDRSVNDLTVIAGRIAGYQFANECAHLAAQVDIGACLVGGAS